MSDIEKAARDAVEAQVNSEQLALIQAVLMAQQLTQQQTCQHPPASLRTVESSPNTGKWIALGIAGPFLAASLAFSLLAAAIAAVCATGCLLVLRSMWRDFEKGKAKGR